MDVWRAGGPQIDFMSPDIYSATDFMGFCEKYTQSGNPLFIPETGGDMDSRCPTSSDGMTRSASPFLGSKSRRHARP